MTDQQSTNIRRVDNLTVGDHLSDHQGVHELVHIYRFDNGDTPMIALTARALSTGVPWLSRHAVEDEVRVATADEIREYEVMGRRRAFANTLCEIADQVNDERLPLGRITADLTVFLDDDAGLDQWAKALGIEVSEPSGWPRVTKEMPGLSVKVYGQQPSKTGR